VLQDEDRAVLSGVALTLDALERNWERVAGFCSGMPRTLVHGDFVMKNLRVRPGPEGLRLFPLDWETAGWGVPAADLAQFSGSLAANPDLTAYGAVVRRVWGGLEEGDLRQLAQVGLLFRLLSAVSWASDGLGYTWVRRSMTKMRSYAPRLADWLRAAGWEDGVDERTVAGVP
jgi:aminoglycoside phosphotransferase (APT) family kinase protein